jgi:hypothetical protein
MNSEFSFKRDGWLNSSVNDAEERAFVRLSISIDGTQISRNVSKRGGGESSAINTSLLPLSEFLAANWWPLLYEPVRPTISDAFRVRHRLDSGMRGYAFPALALWSGGESTIFADWSSFDNPFSTLSFLAPHPEEPAQIRRDTVEIALLDLIEAVLERTGSSASDLFLAWERVRQSIANPDELAYCRAAGRLGLDPYDPDAPDLSVWAAGVPETLFADVSEIVEVNDLQKTSEWLRESDARLKLFPEINFNYFGNPAADDLNNPAWMAGHASAELLHAQATVSIEEPRRAIDEILGSAISREGTIGEGGPDGVSALVQRLTTSAKIGTVARSARQRRFRACAATYIAWTAMDGDERAATDASTRRQQASRAFAAEMLAPQQALLARASSTGFDGEDIEQLAGEFICPFETVAWQAYRAGIPLRGVELTFNSRANVVTSQASL